MTAQSVLVLYWVCLQPCQLSNSGAGVRVGRSEAGVRGRNQGFRSQGQKRGRRRVEEGSRKVDHIRHPNGRPRVVGHVADRVVGPGRALVEERHGRLGVADGLRGGEVGFCGCVDVCGGNIGGSSFSYGRLWVKRPGNGGVAYRIRLWDRPLLARRG